MLENDECMYGKDDCMYGKNDCMYGKDGCMYEKDEYTHEMDIGCMQSTCEYDTGYVEHVSRIWSTVHLHIYAFIPSINHTFMH